MHIILTCSSWFSQHILEIVGMLVNSALAIWIVRTLQKNLADKRVLKDHFIIEIKEIRKLYENIVFDLNRSASKPKDLIPLFKLYSVQTKSLMTLVYDAYEIDPYLLKPYQIELRELVTEMSEFIEGFQDNVVLNLGATSRNQLMVFHQKNQCLFNEIIILINRA